MLTAHPEVDVVNVLTPSGLHPKHVIDIVKKYKKHKKFRMNIKMQKLNTLVLSKLLQHYQMQENF